MCQTNIIWASRCAFPVLCPYEKIFRCPTVLPHQVLEQVSFGFLLLTLEHLAVLEAVRSEKKRKMEEAPEFAVHVLRCQ
jgi:hypothetical protein